MILRNPSHVACLPIDIEPVYLYHIFPNRPTQKEDPYHHYMTIREFLLMARKLQLDVLSYVTRGVTIRKIASIVTSVLFFSGNEEVS